MKKIFCLIFTFVMMLSSIGNVNAFATSLNVLDSKLEDMETDIKNEIEIARKEIYRQLEQQDALILMEVYEDIIYPQIEEQIRDEYKVDHKELKISSTSYYSHTGGMVTYLSPISGYKPTEVVSVYLDRDASYDFILEMYSFTISDILFSILGYIPYVGDISSLTLDMQGTADRVAISRIRDAGGCANIINTYSREFGTRASLVTGWSGRYHISVPSSAIDINFTRF